MKNVTMDKIRLIQAMGKKYTTGYMAINTKYNTGSISRNQLPSGKISRHKDKGTVTRAHKNVTKPVTSAM
jgi:hypothetical protein